MNWSTDPEENAAVEGLRDALRAMAALLHGVDSARYIDPAGGFVVS